MSNPLRSLRNIKDINMFESVEIFSCTFCIAHIKLLSPKTPFSICEAIPNLSPACHDKQIQSACVAVWLKPLVQWSHQKMIWEWHNCHPGLRSNLNKRYFWKNNLGGFTQSDSTFEKATLPRFLVVSPSTQVGFVLVVFLSCAWSISFFIHFSETNESTTFDQTVVHIGQRDHGKRKWFTIEFFFGGFYNLFGTLIRLIFGDWNQRLCHEVHEFTW